MKNIALIGGMGTGKSSLAKVITDESPEIDYIHMSRYGAIIPLTLIATTHPQLLTYYKQLYIDTILQNKDIPTLEFARRQMEEFNILVDKIYGETITSEVVLRTLRPEVRYLADNVHKVGNVRNFKQNGFYIVGLTCSFETQVQRRLIAKKSIDPSDQSQLEAQVRMSNNVFQISNTLRLADNVYDTDQLNLNDYPRIARDILDATS